MLYLRLHLHYKTLITGSVNLIHKKNHSRIKLQHTSQSASPISQADHSLSNWKQQQLTLGTIVHSIGQQMYATDSSWKPHDQSYNKPQHKTHKLQHQPTSNLLISIKNHQSSPTLRKYLTTRHNILPVVHNSELLYFGITTS